MNHYQHQNPLGGSHQDHMMHHNHHSGSGSCHSSSPPSAAHAHGGHDHSHHHGHSGGGGDMCSMNMLLNWSTTDLCIFSHHFRIPADSWLLWAAGLGFVFLFCAGYEGVKSTVRGYDAWIGREVELITTKKDLIHHHPEKDSSSTSCRSSSNSSGNDTAKGLGKKAREVEFARSKKLTRGILYALQYFYGMMAMLLFMTYNVQVMAACTLGALVGFVRFAEDVPGAAGGEESKGACH